jgi:hypothetical protein
VAPHEQLIVALAACALGRRRTGSALWGWSADSHHGSAYPAQQRTRASNCLFPNVITSEARSAANTELSGGYG